jgi:hypothetical protein
MRNRFFRWLESGRVGPLGSIHGHLPPVRPGRAGAAAALGRAAAAYRRLPGREGGGLDGGAGVTAEACCPIATERLRRLDAACAVLARRRRRQDHHLRVRLLESPLAHNQVLRGAAVDQAQVRPSRHHCIAWASASRAWLTLDDGESAMDRRDALSGVVLMSSLT